MSFKMKGLPMSWTKLFWKGAADASFTVRNAYNLLVSGSTSMFPIKNIWVPSVPFKIAFFASEVAWGKVLTPKKGLAASQ